MRQYSAAFLAGYWSVFSVEVVSIMRTFGVHLDHGLDRAKLET